MINYLYIFLGLSLGLLVYFLLSPLSTAAIAFWNGPRPRTGIPRSGVPEIAGPKSMVLIRPIRRCPLCGNLLQDGEGVKVKSRADGTLTLLGCSHCISSSERN